MKSREELGSFDCLNKNALLGAALRSTGIIINEPLRQTIIKQFQKLHMLATMYVVKKYHYLKYEKLAKIHGNYESLQHIFESTAFFWVSKLGTSPTGKQLIEFLYANFYKDGEPYSVDQEKLQQYSSKEIVDKLIEYLGTLKVKNFTSLADIVRKRGAYPTLLELFREELKPEMLQQYNEENVRKLRKVLQVKNLKTINNNLHQLYTLDQYDAAIKAYTTADMFSKEDIIDIEQACKSASTEVDFNAVLLLYFTEQGAKEIKDRFKSFSSLLDLYNHYVDWQKFNDLPHISLLTDVQDNEIIYDGRARTLEELYQIVEDFNFNSPMVKQDIRQVMIDRYFDLVMVGKFYYERMLKLREVGKDITSMQSPEAYDKFCRAMEAKGGVRNQGEDFKEYYEKIFEDADFDHITWVRYCLLGDSPTDLYIDDSDDGHDVHELYKYAACYSIVNRIFKQLSGYIQGQLQKGMHPLSRSYEDGTLLYNDNADTGEYVYKPDFGVNRVNTKRWSAGVQTWRQGTDAFRVLEAEKDHLAIYFDISQAEVRCSAFMSQDPTMTDMYNRGVDIYMKMVETAYPGNQDPAFIKEHRKPMKGIVLGILYGRGAASVAKGLKITEEEARKFMNVFRDMFPVAAEWIERKKKYCKDHHGKIDTILGDRLTTDEDKYATRGINWVIQSFTAMMLAEGFYNLYYESYLEKHYIVPKIVVHDSVTTTFHTKDFFYVLQNINKHFRQYILDRYGVPLKYDMLTMKNFRDKCDFNWDPATKLLTIEGVEPSVNTWIEEMRKFHELDLQEEKYLVFGNKNIIEDFTKKNQIQTFTYYPDNNYKVPNTVKRTYKVTTTYD